MISICIPIYNFKVGKLVRDLSSQARNLSQATEIILIDDGSNSEIKEANENICGEYTYIKLEKNIGRAAIRNKFLDHTQFKYLLFLDCDSLLTSPDFLKNYITLIKHGKKQLVCGGRVQQTKPPERGRLLRWKYANAKESKTPQQRNKNPNKSFMTNNFLIQRDLFKKVSFDERIKGYGHEDTLFGFELKKKKTTICHIHNPVMNADLESNANFILQSEKAISNLIQILKTTHFDRELINDVTILRLYYKLYKFRNINNIIFAVLSPLIKYFLSQGFISIILFDYYKLGLFSLNMEREKTKKNYDNLK